MRADAMKQRRARSGGRGAGLLGLAAVAGAMLAGAAAAELTVAPPAGDAMVIQRGAPVVLRGTAPAGREIAVRIAGRQAVARADAAGRWAAELPPLPAGGPHELLIVAGGDEVRLRDVLVGDVWVCSGQSNMEWVVADSADAAREIAATRDPGIRHLKVPRAWATAPRDELPECAWERADPEHVGGFTAVGYFFARELRPHVDVPIGLINASWGGSRIEPWMSAGSLKLDAAALAKLTAAESDYEREVMARLRARAGTLPERDGGLVEGRAVWADPALDDASWMTIRVPTHWEDGGWEGMDGIAWYRTAFTLTAPEARAGVRLGLGTIDDSDIAWVNGREVGRTVLAWNRPRVYAVPAEALREGRNVVTVRVEDTGGGGGMYGEPGLLFVEAGGARRPLAGEWRFRLGVATVNLDFHKSQVPTMLYNAMIRPLQRTPVKGVLWYQGESNASPEDAFVYRRLFAAMIRDWQAGWGRGELPFLWVQLANFMAAQPEPSESSWALLRESQSAALALPATGQAIAIDIGDAADIHPRNKQEVGRRLALAARAVVYGEKIEHSGPTYRSHEVRDGRIVVAFDHVGGGLEWWGDASARLMGFAIAGADRRFVWADAAIENGRVVAWSDLVPSPVAVRYAWADNPEGPNLINPAGLPASPFRTDDW